MVFAGSSPVKRFSISFAITPTLSWTDEAFGNASYSKVRRQASNNVDFCNGFGNFTTRYVYSH